MQSQSKLDTLKVIGGGTIVLTALCIMLPGVMGYAFSLARLGLVILIAVVVSSLIGFLWQFLVKQKKKEEIVDTSTGKSLETNQE